MRSPALLAIALVAAGSSAAQESADVAARQAQAEAERLRREVDRAAAEARVRAAADQSRIDREAADRVAAEARRQQALAAEHARRQSQLEAQSQAVQAEADLVRRNAEQRARNADEDARRVETMQRHLEPMRPAPAEPPVYLPRRRHVPSPAARDDADRPIAMKEGVVLCERDSDRRWRCIGPSAVTYGPLEAGSSTVTQACGADTIRRLGTVHGFRAFGCGFGLNPRSAAPGNRDVPALFRIEIPGRASFRCLPTIAAFCRR